MSFKSEESSNIKIEFDNQQYEHNAASSSKFLKREEKLIFKKLIVPMAMRSIYWKYFGFPSQDGETVYTKEKVVCALCRAVLAYNKNTTNLKSHLISKHKSVLSKNERIINRKKFITNKSEELSLVKEIDLCEIKDFKSADNTESEDNDENIDNITYNFFSVDENSQDQILPIESMANTIDKNNEHYTHNVELMEMENTNNNYDVIEEIDVNQEASTQNNDISLINMIIYDLCPIDLIRGDGIYDIVRNITHINLPMKENILKYISDFYHKQKHDIISVIYEKMKTHFYSLSIEKFRNIDNIDYAIVSINFIEIESKVEMMNITIDVVVSKIELNNFTIDVLNFDEIQDIFEKFNLSKTKCIAIIVNFNVNNLFSLTKIPIVPCFRNIIKNCIQKIFENETVINIFHKIYDSNNILCKMSAFERNYWLTKWSLLNEFLNLSETDETNDIYTKLSNCLRPLKVTLDLLQSENIPNSSLIKPLITQLIENHFTPDFNTDSVTIQEIKIYIKIELETIIETASPFLSVASFLDPRFTHLIKQNETDEARAFLREKYENSICDKGLSKKLEHRDITCRGSGLDFFFQDTKHKSKQHHNKFDQELDKFMNEEPASLEQCPITWWTEEGYLFPNLSKVAPVYSSVPACINEMHSLNYHQKRYLLQDNVKELLYLHLNAENL